MPDDLQQMMEWALPCRCQTWYDAETGLPSGYRAVHCPRHALYGPAVLSALREAENKGAAEMRDRNAARVYGLNGYIYGLIMEAPLPHPKQESPNG